MYDISCIKEAYLTLINSMLWIIKVIPLYLLLTKYNSLQQGAHNFMQRIQNLFPNVNISIVIVNHVCPLSLKKQKKKKLNNFKTKKSNRAHKNFPHSLWFFSFFSMFRKCVCFASPFHWWLHSLYTITKKIIKNQIHILHSGRTQPTTQRNDWNECQHNVLVQQNIKINNVNALGWAP